MVYSVKEYKNFTMAFIIFITSKCDFMYAHRYTTAFPVVICMKLMNFQQCYVQVS